MKPTYKQISVPMSQVTIPNWNVMHLSGAQYRQIESSIRRFSYQPILVNANFEVLSDVDMFLALQRMGTSTVNVCVRNNGWAGRDIGWKSIVESIQKDIDNENKGSIPAIVTATKYWSLSQTYPKAQRGGSQKTRIGKGDPFTKHFARILKKGSTTISAYVRIYEMINVHCPSMFGKSIMDDLSFEALRKYVGKGIINKTNQTPSIAMREIVRRTILKKKTLLRQKRNNAAIKKDVNSYFEKAIQGFSNNSNTLPPKLTLGDPKYWLRIEEKLLQGDVFEQMHGVTTALKGFVQTNKKLSTSEGLSRLLAMSHRVEDFAAQIGRIAKVGKIQSAVLRRKDFSGRKQLKVIKRKWS